MNKPDLIREVRGLRKEINELNKNNNFLLNQQKELNKHYEKIGGEIAKWKHKSIKLEEENKLLLSMAKTWRRK